jgi:hypothetical protein
MSKATKEKIETGQIYIIKPDSKHKDLPEAKTIKIGDYYQEGEDKYKLKELWHVLIKNDSGDWVPPKNHLLFRQQIEANFTLEFEPLVQAKSRLDDIED